MDMPTLRTRSLILRATTMADWAAYAAMWADPRVTAHIGGAPRPRDVAWTKFGQSVAMWTLFGYGMWTVVDGNEARFLGLCGFARYERDILELEGFPEAGWAFAPQSWGRGVASEAVGAIVAWADANDIAETRCMIDDANHASVRVATRNGYTPFAALCDKKIFRRRAPSPADR